MAAQNNFINQLLEAAFRGETYTGGTIRMGLFRNGTPTSGGVEISGGGYSRQVLTFGAASNKEISTSAKATFTNMPTSQTVIAYGIYDDTTLIDENTLPSPFQADVTNNELEISYKFNLGA